MRLLLAALIGASVMIGSAGVAYGDPNDDAFLASMQQAGIIDDSAAHAIATARAVCMLWDRGESTPDIVAALEIRNPNLTTNQATKFVEVVERAYCPA